MRLLTTLTLVFVLAVGVIVPARADAASLKFYGGKISNNAALDPGDCPFFTCAFFNISGQLVTNPQDLLPKLDASGAITQQPKQAQYQNKSYKVFKTGILAGPCSPGKSILGYGGTWDSYIVNIFGWCG